MAVIDIDLVTSFLEHLATARHNSTATCNARLTAIRAVLAQALPDHPEAPNLAGHTLISANALNRNLSSQDHDLRLQ